MAPNPMNVAAFWLFLAGLRSPTSASAVKEPTEDRVADLVASMTLEEKYSLLNGVGWDYWAQEDGYYIGNTPPVTRLGIPSLNMQDAGQGFRTSDPRMVGQVTSWSCALGLASNWDPDVVTEWATAVADEYKAKSANVILGPGLNVHRVPRGGRNAEYMSGEDPYLGQILGPAYVKGFQDNGVMTVMKHFGLNNQETNRDTYSANIPDARALFEVYYPPYKACADAGVAATMCSYNLVNDTHSCMNAQLLASDLKTTLGFDGWVMSDWAATHALAATEGLDQDMPGSNVDDGYTDYYSAENLASVSNDTINDMVTRILTPMATVGVLDEEWCVPGESCDDYLYSVNATSEAHSELATKIATNSVILLQNEDDTLPLTHADGSNLTIGVVGAACDAPNDVDQLVTTWNEGNYYVVGGSGRVIPDSVVTIVEGITQRVSADSSFQIVVSLSDDVDAAMQVADAVDVLVACGGTNTTESQDRASLSLDQDDFLSAVATGTETPTVVVMMTPSTVLTSWKDGVESILNIFLGGKATGTAIASVLFGDVNPYAKSPVTYPAKEDDMVAPCTETDCEYSEGLFVGYRALDAANTTVNFPFGHGLSYTTFTYGLLGFATSDSVVSITVSITNGGAVAGAEVAQLYVKFPDSAAMPPKVMKGFQKTSILDPSGSETITFSVLRSELQIWNNMIWDWDSVSGTFEFMIGSSSRDIRLSVEVDL